MRAYRRTRFSLRIVILVSVLLLGSLIALASLGSTRASGVSSHICNLSLSQQEFTAQVTGNPRFVEVAGDLSYTLIYEVNQSATTGVVNATIVRTNSDNSLNKTGGAGESITGGMPYYSPPFTEAVFYSYGSSPQAACVNSPNSNQRVVSVLQVDVPLSTDGLYNFSGMRLYQTPGLYVNGTQAS